jgi:hypothetical protein
LHESVFLVESGGMFIHPFTQQVSNKRFLFQNLKCLWNILILLRLQNISITFCCKRIQSPSHSERKLDLIFREWISWFVSSPHFCIWVNCNDLISSTSIPFHCIAFRKLKQHGILFVIASQINAVRDELHVQSCLKTGFQQSECAVLQNPNSTDWSVHCKYRSHLLSLFSTKPSQTVRPSVITSRGMPSSAACYFISSWRWTESQPRMNSRGSRMRPTSPKWFPFTTSVFRGPRKLKDSFVREAAIAGEHPQSDSVIHSQRLCPRSRLKFGARPDVLSSGKHLGLRYARHLAPLEEMVPKSWPNGSIFVPHHLFVFQVCHAWRKSFHRFEIGNKPRRSL